MLQEAQLTGVSHPSRTPYEFWGAFPTLGSEAGCEKKLDLGIPQHPKALWSYLHKALALPVL